MTQGFDGRIYPARPLALSSAAWDLLGAARNQGPAAWQEAVAATGVLQDHRRLSLAAQALLEARHSSILDEFGAGSGRLLIESFAPVLAWAERFHEPARGSFESFVESLWQDIRRAHRGRFRPGRLRNERDDERERDAAHRGGVALVNYARKWRKRLEQLQLVDAAKWTVPNLTEPEVVDALELKLIEAVTLGNGFAEYAEPGCEWGFLFLAAEKDAQRARRRIYVVNGRTPHIGDLVGDPVLTPEELLIAHDDVELQKRALLDFERRLSKPQRSWLAAFQLVAGGEAVFLSGKVNLAKVARSRGKSRSSALRAQRELQTLFTQAVARAEGGGR